MKKQYFGKYRGTVTNNCDPEMRGRLMVSVPDVLGPHSGAWAEACTPLAGPGAPMGFYAIPAIGTTVWVEFEQGNADYPIWAGCLWGASAAIPDIAKKGLPSVSPIVIQTAGQHVLALSDIPGPEGGILLKSSTGASIIINDTGIYIQNGKGASLALVGTEVKINEATF